MQPCPAQSYAMPCASRAGCGLRSDVSANRGVFDYHMNTAAVLRPNAMALGSVGGVGRVAGYYGAKRSTIACHDPTVWQRSYLSSGCGTNALTAAIPDGRDVPIIYTPEQQALLNKGSSIQSYSSRLGLEDDSIRESHILASYRLSQPNESMGAYTTPWGISGSYIPSRQVGLCQSQSQYLSTQGKGINAGHFGSYGVL